MSEMDLLWHSQFESSPTPYVANKNHLSPRPPIFLQLSFLSSDSSLPDGISLNQRFQNSTQKAQTGISVMFPRNGFRFGSDWSWPLQLVLGPFWRIKVEVWQLYFHIQLRFMRPLKGRAQEKERSSFLREPLSSVSRNSKEMKENVNCWATYNRSSSARARKMWLKGGIRNKITEYEANGIWGHTALRAYHLCSIAISLYFQRFLFEHGCHQIIENSLFSRSRLLRVDKKSWRVKYGRESLRERTIL